MSARLGLLTAACAADTVVGVETNVKNKVGHTYVPKTRPLMPLFEAIVNSIEAIEERTAGTSGMIRVEIVRRADLRPGDQATMEPPPISGFVVRDNGVGFHHRNYQSFGEAESDYKLRRGCKGVGRFLWLAAFREVMITSVYADEGKRWRRRFRFSQDIPGGIEPLEHVEAEAGTPLGSTVELIDVLDEVASLRAFPRDALRLGWAILEHCTGHFLNPTCPQIEVDDPEDKYGPLALTDIFASMTESRIAGKFEAAGHLFDLVIMKRRPTSGDTPHRVRLCADYREVTHYSLSDDIPQLPKRLAGEWRWVADVYVFGKHLDANVDPTRTRFKFEEFDSDTESLFRDHLSMRSLRAAVAEAALQLLQDIIEPDRERWHRAVVQHIQKTSQRYSVLLKTAKDKLRNLPIDLPPDRLEAELAKLLFQHRQGIEAALTLELKLPRPVNKRVKELAKQVHEVQRAQLAEYVMRRHAIIAYLRAALAPDPKDPKYKTWNFESLLHDMIFPRKKSSTTIDPEQANLWLLDDRLGMADEVLSDLPVDQANAESSHPDVLVYDRTISIADSAHPRSVMIFEFKRPGRDDYGPWAGKDPVQQLKTQVYELRTGPVRTPNGMRTVPSSTPIFVYLVADATETLQKFLGMNGWTASSDKRAHVHLDPVNNAVYQQITWQDLLDTASARHQEFFDRLDLSQP